MDALGLPQGQLINAGGEMNLGFLPPSPKLPVEEEDTTDLLRKTRVCIVLSTIYFKIEIIKLCPEPLKYPLAQIIFT